ncbi:MAG TPA: c-type cytochrome [Steroidobacteraceae bacterium]|nr:c-type cytochrome [Steroidobacteraceae bacterium]
MSSLAARILAMLLICSCAHAAGTVAQRVQPCTTCHGERGHATNEGYYPRIAGKPAGYLFNQMVNFRAGRRHFPMMVYFMGLQDDAALHQMAEYFAAQQVAYPPPESPDVGAALLERGRQLVTQGDPSLKIPACTACHGTQLLGVAPDVPGLLGVSQDYLMGQLGAWRNGSRAAMAPDCMSQIARRLQPQDLAAVTAWLASRAVPPDAQTQTAFVQPPPLQCGSIEPATAQAAAAPSAVPSAALPSAAVRPITAAAGAAGEAERGRELVTLGDCEVCHTARGGAAFAGGRAIPTPFGTFYSPNITPDDDTGIGRWSEQDFWHALHDGYAPDGTPLYPAFPYTNYTRIARADADAMFAYLRTVAAVSQPNRAHQLQFPYNHRWLLRVWRSLYFRPGVYRSDSAHDAEWNRGAYLVQGLGHCSACHAARNSLGATLSGTSPPGGLALSWFAPSLTNSAQAGVHGWSLDDIVTLLQSGAIGVGADADAGAGSTADASSPHAVTLGPMSEVVFSSLQHLSDTDLHAMAVYLKSLPDSAAGPASARAQVLDRASDTLMYDGRTIYDTRCASCHGREGEGHAPLGPPLAGNRAVTMDSDVNPIRIVLFGGYPPGTALDPLPFGMPPFSQALDDDQIAEVLSYVRQSWGNAASSVQADSVHQNRGSPLW